MMCGLTFLPAARFTIRYEDDQATDIEVDPVVHLYFVEVEQPDMHTPEGDLQRLLRALEVEWAQQVGPGHARVMQEALRKGKWQVTVALRYGSQIVSMPWGPVTTFTALPSTSDPPRLRFIFVMTSGQVLASSGAMNPQIRFGEDLMSRVSMCGSTGRRRTNDDSGAPGHQQTDSRHGGTGGRSCRGCAGRSAGWKSRDLSPAAGP